eukprot:scaffold80163_cov43-Cyclotella_meneghiniana.AAC.1
MVQVLSFEVSQSKYRLRMLSGRMGLFLLKPSQTPWCAYCKHLFVVLMYEEMALVRGCCNPRPPCLIAMLAMMCEWVGRSKII